MDPITSAIVQVVTSTAKAVLPRLLTDSGRDPSEVAERIAQHVAETEAWSRYTQIFGSSEPAETDAVTIRLRLYPGAMKFASGDSTAHRTEEDLLADANHYVVLGQPGAGKTTTLKRLVRELLSEPTNEDDTYQYPVAIRLREIDPGTSLIDTLAAALGIAFNAETKKEGQIKVGKLPLDDYVVDYLNATVGVVLLDGLDEVPTTRRRNLHVEIVRLGFRLTTSKIVVTCRTGDYQSLFDGFTTVEVCPLQADEVRQLAARTLGDPTDFLDALSHLPYGDVADRPLLLAQLIFLYSKYGYLPEQPCLVYRRLVALLLEEWDVQRSVVRSSKYAGFTTDRKAEFLSALAFHLLFVTKAKTFTERQLREAYTAIHTVFRLPKEEAQQVVEELEGHTGIIASAGLDRFEFSHLSLQEYLCANYIAREPLATNIDSYLTDYPGPVAVAVTLASRPANAFAALILKHSRNSKIAAGALQSFLTRLFIEEPPFDIAPFLGVAVMKLLHDHPSGRTPELDVILERLIAMPYVKQSIVAGLRWYKRHKISNPHARQIELYSIETFVDGLDVPLPDVVSIPKTMLDDLIQNDDLRQVRHLSESWFNG